MIFFDKPFRLEIYTTIDKERKLVETENLETIEKARSWASYRMRCYAIQLARETTIKEPWNAISSRILEEKAEGFIDAHGHDGWTENKSV